MKLQKTTLKNLEKSRNFQIFQNKIFEPFKSPPLCVQDETKCDNIQYGKYQGIFNTVLIILSRDSYNMTNIVQIS